MKQELKTEIQSMIEQAITPLNSSINSVRQGGGLTPFHRHNGIDSAQIPFKNLFRIFTGQSVDPYAGPGLIAAGGTVTVSLTCKGAGAGDYALASYDDITTANMNRVQLLAKVSAIGVVSVTFFNTHTVGVTPAAGVLSVVVIRKP